VTKSAGFYRAIIIPIFLIFLFASCSVKADQPTAVPGTPSTVDIKSTNSPSYWSPSPKDRFQIQLSEYPPDLQADVDVFELDLFETTKDEISFLHTAGKKVICYMNAGAWEEFRPDAADFPAEIIGNAYDGWEGVDTDNINGFQQNTGFPIAAQDQLSYNIWLTEQAHARGLSIAMKNNNIQVTQLVDYFDYAVVEDYAVYDECDDFLPFALQGKTVFQIEYTDNWYMPKDFCAESLSNRFTPLFKNRELDAWFRICGSHSG